MPGGIGPYPASNTYVYVTDINMQLKGPPLITYVYVIGKKTYQAAIGSLTYLMLGSRPDLAFAINKLAQYSANPTERHWKGIKRVLQKTAAMEMVLPWNKRYTDIDAVSESDWLFRCSLYG